MSHVSDLEYFLGDALDDELTSREFIRSVDSGEETLCERPWRSLKILPDNHTRICCDFFSKLPQFDFPDAKSFHASTGMWNHPLMQNLRTTMGTPDELPFCTLCMTKDKRNPKHKSERAEAVATSLARFRAIEDAARDAQRNGTLETAPEDLTNFSLNFEGKEIRPFRRDKGSYRRSIAARGFEGAGRVLFLGCAPPAYAPFLAETCRELVLSDKSVRAVTIAEHLCAHFELEARIMPPDGLGDYEPGSFDAVWVNAQAFLWTSPVKLAQRIRAVVRRGGLVFFHKVAGPGRVLEAAIEGLGLHDAALRRMNWTDITKRESGLFVTTSSLGRTMRELGFRLDGSRPLSADWSPKDIRMKAKTAALQFLLTDVDAGLYDGQTPARYERAISFSCWA